MKTDRPDGKSGAAEKRRAYRYARACQVKKLYQGRVHQRSEETQSEQMLKLYLLPKNVEIVRHYPGEQGKVSCGGAKSRKAVEGSSARTIEKAKKNFRQMAQLKYNRSPEIGD